MFNEMTAFVRTVNLKTISAAARDLHLSVAACSYRIQNLEQIVGVRLLHRTTRSLQPTPAGQIFYEHCLDVLEAVERAQNSMTTASRDPMGTISVTAPVGVGRRILAPLVFEFNALYPRIEINLRLTDHIVDFVAESVDIAVRMANLPDSSAIVRRIANCPRVLCASPSYVACHGRPTGVDDLLRHTCLVHRLPGSSHARWSFNTSTGIVELPVSSRFGADDGDVLTEWAVNGHGIMLKPLWEVAEHLRTGALEALLPEAPATPVGLALLYPNKRLMPSRVRLFADFLVEHVKATIAQSETGRPRVENDQQQREVAKTAVVTPFKRSFRVANR